MIYIIPVSKDANRDKVNKLYIQFLKGLSH